MTGPTKCIDTEPNAQTIKLAGRYVNLKRIARAGPFNRSYISYILSGKRCPSTKFFKRLATCLGMTMDDLLQAIEERKATRHDKVFVIETEPEIPANSTI